MSRDKSEHAVEQRAREVIDDLTDGLVGRSTVKDIADATHRASRNGKATDAIGRALGRPASGRPFGL